MIEEIRFNIIAHPFSTVLGLVLIVTGIYTGVTARQSWTESSIVIGGGCVVMGLKDPFSR